MDPITLMMLGLGLGQTVYGFIQNAHGKQLARRTVRDAYQIPDEAFQNLGMWEQLGQEGMPQNELDFIHQNALRGLSASLSTGLQLGADPNSVGDYYQNYLDKLGDIGVRSATMRFSNLNNLANAREELINQRQIQFGYDDAKKRDEAQLATLEQNQGMQNVFGGINTAASGVVQGQNRKLYQDQIENQKIALGLDQNQGIPTQQMPPRTYRSDPIIGNRVPGVGQNIDNTRVIANWLNRNNLSTNSTDSSSYFWRKYGQEGNLFWWTTPGEHK